METCKLSVQCGEEELGCFFFKDIEVANTDFCSKKFGSEGKEIKQLMARVGGGVKRILLCSFRVAVSNSLSLRASRLPSKG